MIPGCVPFCVPSRDALPNCGAAHVVGNCLWHIASGISHKRRATQILRLPGKIRKLPSSGPMRRNSRREIAAVAGANQMGALLRKAGHPGAPADAHGDAASAHGIVFRRCDPAEAPRIFPVMNQGQASAACISFSSQSGRLRRRCSPAPAILRAPAGRPDSPRAKPAFQPMRITRAGVFRQLRRAVLRAVIHDQDFSDGISLPPQTGQQPSSSARPFQTGTITDTSAGFMACACRKSAFSPGTTGWRSRRATG